MTTTGAIDAGVGVLAPISGALIPFALGIAMERRKQGQAMMTAEFSFNCATCSNCYQYVFTFIPLPYTASAC
ncbi:hypothetical protein VNO80_09340 [Phaseolus coccineus]|uniref:Uncharacterized protein n=1 Tax=Phaseolus coccineus TaxID=3886 RepID=A0AAN9N7T1_PHACN